MAEQIRQDRLGLRPPLSQAGRSARAAPHGPGAGAASAGTVSGRFAEIGEAVQQEIGQQRGTPIAMNIDGATAVIFCELGFPPPLARGLFCLSRSVGALAHGWEQMQQGGRNKGPMPSAFLPHYEGDPE